MISSILDKDTREELKKTLDVVILPIKIYCIMLLLLFLVVIFQLHLISRDLKK